MEPSDNSSSSHRKNLQMNLEKAALTYIQWSLGLKDPWNAAALIVDHLIIFERKNGDPNAKSNFGKWLRKKIPFTKWKKKFDAYIKYQIEHVNEVTAGRPDLPWETRVEMFRASCVRRYRDPTDWDGFLPTPSFYEIFPNVPKSFRAAFNEFFLEQWDKFLFG